MIQSPSSRPGSFAERRRFPRYVVPVKITLAVEDESCGEQLGIGEPFDIGLGGLRVINLPACPSVRVGDRLGLLLVDTELTLSLRGEVVHHGSANTFGVEFQHITMMDRDDIGHLIERLRR